MKPVVDTILIIFVALELGFFGMLIYAGVKKLLQIASGKPERTYLPVTFFFNHSFIKTTGGIIMLKLQNDELARFVVGAPKDIKGEDAVIESGSLKVTSSNEEVFTVAPDEKDPENNTAFKAVAGRSGAAVLRIEADADLGEGVKTIFTEIAVEVTASGAVGFGEPQFAVEKQELGQPQ